MKNREQKNLTRQLHATNPSVRRIIELARDIAKSRQVEAYLVGGFVRDMVLGIANFDVDIVVEKEGIPFAQQFSHALGAALVQHHMFGTATVTLKEGLKIDIATCRKERYPAPAQLPIVSAGTIGDDLFRRDFTINAMACHIDAERFGELVDIFRGLDDIRNKRIRFLHEESFIDDPTRIIRAVRFEQRLGFHIEPQTLRAIRNARTQSMLEKVHSHRLRDELILLFKERDPYRTVRRLGDVYNLTFVDKRLCLRPQLKQVFQKISRDSQWLMDVLMQRRQLDTWLMYMTALIAGLPLPRIRHFLNRSAFRNGEKIRALYFKKNYARLNTQLSHAGLSAVKLHSLLDPLSYEVIVLVLAFSKRKRTRQGIREFFLEHHHKKITITGADLVLLGLAPGPEFGKIFKAVLRAKIAGKLHTHDDELAFAKKILSRK